jgi:acetyl-CoA carboxylase carboxyl transferase subunit beta
LGFRDSAAYVDRVKESRKKTGEKEAMVAGVGKIGGQPVVAAVWISGLWAGPWAVWWGKK